MIAREADVELVDLAFAGQCQLDPFMGRVIRDTAAHLISLKLGINLVNAASMSERTFGPAVHGLLDDIRDIMDDIIADHESTIAHLESYIQS